MKCRSCKSKDVIELLSLGNQYLSDFRDDNIVPPKYPLDLMLCQNCFFVQLRESAPLSELYTPRYGFKSGVNSTIRADLENIAEQSKRYLTKTKTIWREADIGNGTVPVGTQTDERIVVDIGANDGTLLSNFSHEFYKIGIEPIEKLAVECSLVADHVINGFFDGRELKKVLGESKVDIFTSISMFYDVEDPAKFVEEVEELMDWNGVWIIQQNYLLATIENHAIDNICHEHIGYHSLKSMEHLLSRFDLEVVDVSTSMVNGGVLRTVVQRKGVGVVLGSVEALRKREEAAGLGKIETYKKFEVETKNLIKELQDLIYELVVTGKKIMIYGASTRGGTIWQAIGLDNIMIEAAVDRNPKKVGKIIAAIGVPIISEEEARERHPDYMFVSIWFFKEEILKREAEYLKSGGHLIFPLPKLEIV